MNYCEGSLWKKWDLHLHSPCSIVQNYGGDNDVVWEKFILDIESLPQEFKVIGINDYIFVDGYKRIVEYQKSGRLKNIDLFLPVIELRIDKFGGTNSHWNRVNLHIIFSNEVEISTIESQFLSGLSRGYKLSPEHEGIEWNAIPTKETLSDLGRKIIESVPPTKSRDFGLAIVEGFNALNLDFDTVLSLLNTNTYLKGKFFTAVGKTEWENIKWNDNTIAEKKNIVNKVDYLFTSSENIYQFNKAKENLKKSKVNDKLIDCSDAHHFMSSAEKDRIGNCKTWIKADTTFEGLRQTLFEDDRIFIGDMPPKDKDVKEFPHRYIKKLKIYRTDESSLKEKWFNNEIDLNSNMVAIIGKKGAGKSALIDILGLLGNSQIDKNDRSFLCDKKFGYKNKWDNFIAELTWHTGTTISKKLNANIDELSTQNVRFIPQNYFEKICNELQDTSDDSLFYKELNSVIFSHVPVNDRLKAANLGELINIKTHAVRESIEDLSLGVQKKNREIINVEKILSTKYFLEIRNQMEQKEKELATHELNKPKPIEKPNLLPNSSNSTSNIEELKKQEEKLKIQLSGIEEKIVQQKTLQSAIENFKEKLFSLNDIFERTRIDLNSEYSDVITELGGNLEKIMKFSLDIQQVENLRLKKIEIIKSFDDERSKLSNKVSEVFDMIFELQSDLQEEERKYQEFLEDSKNWNNRKSNIIGDENTPDTIQYFQNEIKKINEYYPVLLRDLLKQREDLLRKIFEKKCLLVNEYENLYAPVHKFIEEKSLGEELGLRFSVSICIEEFIEKFFSLISHGQNGTYCGKESAKEMISKIIEKYDFNLYEDVISFVHEVDESLSIDKRTDQNNEKREKEKQLRQYNSLQDLYDFIFSIEYLVPRYVLNLGKKELFQLSPGEKGTLLLIFYLLVDKERIPLLIDQPEHNLDNETIFKLLVESVKIAKENRQLIIVTHNPNLAVVCDAEQVIYASLDTFDDNRVEYLAGAIENPHINRKIIDVLEGTKPAFNKRRFKYLLD